MSAGRNLGDMYEDQLLSEFNRWHRVASENILVATHDEDPHKLDLAAECGVKALRAAENDLQRTLALGLIRAAIDMRVVFIATSRESRKESGRDERDDRREEVRDQRQAEREDISDRRQDARDTP